MMMAAGVGIVLGQHDAVAAHLVDGADMLPVGPQHLHMLGHARKRSALGLAFAAPAAELVLEPGGVLAAIFVIVAVKILDLAAAPAMIVVVAVPAIALTFVLACVGGAAAFRFLVTEP